MTEAQIQKKILDYLTKNNYFNFKVIAANKRGIPDICAVVKGKPLFIEVKRPKVGKVSELQKYQMDKIRASAGFALVATSVEEVDSFIKTIESYSIMM